MVSIVKYKYSNDENAEVFPAGEVMLQSDYADILTHAHHKTDKNGTELKDENNNPIYQLWDVEKGYYVNADSVIRSSNNMSHDKGYILTYKVDNPAIWDTWYTEYADATNNSGKAREKNQIEKGTGALVDAHNGPTYRLNGTGQLLGQRSYKEGDLISDEVYTTYIAAKADAENAGETLIDQATFEEHVAQILTDQVTVTNGDDTYHLYKGHVVSYADVSTLGLTGKVENAYICIGTIQLSKSEFIYVNNRISESEKTDYTTQVSNGIGAILTTITPERLAAIMV